MPSLRAIVRELNRIGGNINQIARAANTSVLQGRAVEPDLSAIHDARTAIETWHSRNCVAHSMATPIIGRHGDDPASLAAAG